jgi:small subunit ribosomal protein S8
MLTRIRNAQRVGTETVDMGHSRIKSEIARVLKKEGFIKDYVVEGANKKKIVRVYLKYTATHKPVIQGIRRQSKSGLRVYSQVRAIPKVMGGMGIVVMSTSHGIMSGKDAQKRGVGGEVICSVW